MSIRTSTFYQYPTTSFVLFTPRCTSFALPE